MYDIKFAMFTIFKCIFSGINNTHNVINIGTLTSGVIITISKSFHHPKETLCTPPPKKHQ